MFGLDEIGVLLSQPHHGWNDFVVKLLYQSINQSINKQNTMMPLLESHH